MPRSAVSGNSRTWSCGKHDGKDADLVSVDVTQDNNGIYVKYSLSFLYEMEIIPKSHLPPFYVKKEYKRRPMSTHTHDTGKATGQLQQHITAAASGTAVQQ